MKIVSVMVDVTGDKVPDLIMITADKTPNSEYLKNIVLMVKNGRSGKVSELRPRNNAGYNPTVFTGDFTGNKVNDILLQIDSGGSGGMTFNYIYSVIDGRFEIIFDSDIYNEEYKYKVNYENYYMIGVEFLNGRKKYLLDILYKGKIYLKELYDANGILKEPVEGFVNPLGSLFPIDLERDGVYELMAFQKIAGRYNADTVGYFENILKWEQRGVKLFEQYVGVLGADDKS